MPRLRVQHVLMPNFQRFQIQVKNFIVAHQRVFGSDVQGDVQLSAYSVCILAHQAQDIIFL